MVARTKTRAGRLLTPLLTCASIDQAVARYARTTGHELQDRPARPGELITYQCAYRPTGSARPRLSKCLPKGVLHLRICILVH